MSKTWQVQYAKPRFSELDEETPRILRVVTLNDGETIHNAFFDRRFRKDQP